MKLESITVQDLLDVADFIYLALDLNQKVVLINKKGCEILGYSEEEIIGKNWFDNFLPKDIVKAKGWKHGVELVIAMDSNGDLIIKEIKK